MFDRHYLVHRQDTVQEPRNHTRFGGQGGPKVARVKIRSPENVICAPQRIAHCRYVACDRAIAKRNQSPRSRADPAQQFEIVGVGNRAFYKANVHILRVLLVINERRIDDICETRQFHKPFVHVKE